MSRRRDRRVSTRKNLSSSRLLRLRISQGRHASPSANGWLKICHAERTLKFQAVVTPTAPYLSSSLPKNERLSPRRQRRLGNDQARAGLTGYRLSDRPKRPVAVCDRVARTGVWLTTVAARTSSRPDSCRIVGLCCRVRASHPANWSSGSEIGRSISWAISAVGSCFTLGRCSDRRHCTGQRPDNRNSQCRRLWRIGCCSNESLGTAIATRPGGHWQHLRKSDCAPPRVPARGRWK